MSGLTTDAVRYCDDADNTTLISLPLAILAAVLDRLGRDEPATTIAGFALIPRIAATIPEITTVIAHPRNVLGEATCESLGIARPQGRDDDHRRHGDLRI